MAGMGAIVVKSAACIIERSFAIRVRTWQMLVVIFTITLLLLGLDSPSYALFLSGLKGLTLDIARSTGNTTISEFTLNILFNFIRLAFVLFWIAFVIFAYKNKQTLQQSSNNH
jgi:hypothetical protein